MNLGFNPRARYLTGPPAGSPSYALRKRRLLAFDARRRYLTGLGDVSLPVTGFPTAAIAPLGPQVPSNAALDFSQLFNYFSQPTVTPGKPVPVAVTPSTAAAIANALPASGAASPSWFSQPNSIFGVSNGVLVGGVGALALLVLLSGGRRR